MKTYSNAYLRPAVDISESRDGFQMLVEMPGVPKTEAEVSVENGQLTISGAIKLDTGDDMSATHVERASGNYRRVFSLGRNLDVDNIQASQADGLLKLWVPKAEQARGKRLEVQAG